MSITLGCWRDLRMLRIELVMSTQMQGLLRLCLTSCTSKSSSVLQIASMEVNPVEEVKVDGAFRNCPSLVAKGKC